MACTSLSWPVAFDLTPKDKRPYAGSTQGNSMLELVAVHNGFDRFVRPRIEAPPRSVPAQLQNFQTYDAVPAGLRVVKISTLSGAVSALENIKAGKPVPSC